MKAVLKNFTIFTGKHLCWSLLLIKLQAFRSFEKHLRTAASEHLRQVKMYFFLLLVPSFGIRTNVKYFSDAVKKL